MSVALRADTLRKAVFRYVLVVCLLFVGAEFSAAGQSGRKNEFKLQVTGVDITSALKILGVNQPDARAGIVYFFDTEDEILRSYNVTLRARSSANRPADAIVKLRAAASSTVLSEEERALPIENDWTNEEQPIESRSLTHEPVEEGLVDSVGSGVLPVAELFTDAQRRLVEARVPNIAWKDFRHFGPIETRVWKKATLAGFSEPVTVELWRLRQGGRTLELLEVSAKARTESDSEALKLARQFFTAAATAGLGKPDNQTKTQHVMDFFSMGRTVTQ